jgi:hypothetical protein
MHLKFQSVIFDRVISSVIKYLTNEVLPENFEEESMLVVLLYVIITILQSTIFAMRVLLWRGNSSLVVPLVRATILDLYYAIL